MKKIKEAIVILAIACEVVCMVGCSKEKEHRDMVEIEVEVIMPDRYTVRDQDRHDVKVTKEDVENITSDVVHDKDEEDKVNRLTAEQKETQLDEEAKKKTEEVFSEIGISAGIEYGNKQFFSENGYIMYSTANDTTISTATIVDGSNNTVEAYVEGSVNGSEYIALIGISKLQCSVEKVEKTMYELGYSGIAKVVDMKGNILEVDIDGEMYSIDIDNGVEAK